MKRIYIPNPTIEEEACTIRDAGLEIRLYRFFDPRTGVVDWEGMREDLQNAPAQSIVLMYVGGSTPTGAELTVGQWRLATEVLKVSKKAGPPTADVQLIRLVCPVKTAYCFDRHGIPGAF